MSIQSKLQALLTAANAVTGEADATLTDAVQTLCGGYAAYDPEAYTHYRLTINDFRRDEGAAPQTYASVAELCVYDENGTDISRSREQTIQYSCSSYLNTGSASRAFDGTKDTHWASDWSGAPNTVNWLQFRLPEAEKAFAFSITPHDEGTNRDFAVGFVLAGSNDGEHWDTLYTASGLTDNWAKGVNRLFVIGIPQA